VSDHFLESSYFCRYVSLRYIWGATGRLAGTKRDFVTNAVLAVTLSGFKAHRRQMTSSETYLKQKMLKRGNPATNTAVHRMVM